VRLFIRLKRECVDTDAALARLAALLGVKELTGVYKEPPPPLTQLYRADVSDDTAEDTLSAAASDPDVETMHKGVLGQVIRGAST
jgi:hypothetical protein